MKRRINPYTRIRIKVALAALAYDQFDTPIMSDAEYDKLALRVYRTRHIGTGNAEMDKFFQDHFTPHTSLWIHKHPHIQPLKNILKRYFNVPPYTPTKRKRRGRRKRSP